MRFATGVHPHQAKVGESRPGHADALVRARAVETSAVAVGEIGLDYHYDFSPRAVQRDVFVEQLTTARALNLPIIIHTREADDDTFAVAGHKEIAMSATIVNLIIQLIAGMIGGNAAAAGMKNASLGTAGNTIAGAIGGLGGGQLLSILMPALAGAAGGGLDIGAIVGQLVGGGVGGAILTIVIGLIKNAMAGQKA